MSTSYDPEGEITEKGSSEHITKDHIEEVLSSFRGKISQRPPIFSAIRIQGKRAYNFARKGKEVHIPLREVEIRSLEIMDYTSPYLTLHVECSSGTYIRSLAHDIGEALGVGAYLTDLKRTSVDSYCLDQSVQILDDSRHMNYSCLESYLIPLQKMHFGLPVVYFTEEKKQRFSQGLPISVEDLSLPTGVKFEVREEGTDSLLGIAELKEGYVKTYKMLI